MKQQENIFLILLILISFLGLYIMFPFSEKVKTLKREVLSLKKETESKENYIQKIKELYENLNKNEIYPLIQTALPQKRDYSDILLFLYQKAVAHGLAFSSQISFSEKSGFLPANQETLSPSFSLKNLEISFSAIGNYEGFKRFLTDLELSQRLFRVKKIDLALSKENFEIKMVVEVYHY